MGHLILKDWKYGEVRAVRMVDGFFVHAGDLMHVLGIKSISSARYGLLEGVERMLPCVNKAGRYAECAYLDEDRAYELLGKRDTALFRWVRSWYRQSVTAAYSGVEQRVVEVRTKKQGSVRENLRKVQLLCLSEYLVHRGYGKGTPLSGAKLVFTNELEAGCNEWRGESGERVTAISVVRDMKLLGYLMRKGNNGCAFWVDVKGSGE